MQPIQNPPKVKVEKVAFDTEKFISLVEQHQILWNTKVPRYFADTASKRQAWLAIANEMFPHENFDIKLEADKDEIANTLWARWKALRDRYTREHRKIKQESGLDTTPFPFLNNLLFLGERPTRAKRQPRNNLETKIKRPRIVVKQERIKEDISEQQVEYEYEEIVNEEPEAEHEIYLETDELEPTHDEEETEYMNQEGRDCLVAALTDALNKQTEQRPKLDEHELFLQSLLPDLRKIPISQKLKVRMDILSVINKALQE